MATTHTPGPWHMGQGNGEGSIFAETGRMRGEAGGTVLYPIAVVVRGWEEAEDEANARLVAEAPALLEALRWALEQIEDDLDPDHQAALAAAWDTVERAEGEAP